MILTICQWTLHALLQGNKVGIVGVTSGGGGGGIQQPASDGAKHDWIASMMILKVYP
jgi:hypothetical protein